MPVHKKVAALSTQLMEKTIGSIHNHPVNALRRRGVHTNIAQYTGNETAMKPIAAAHGTGAATKVHPLR